MASKKVLNNKLLCNSLINLRHSNSLGHFLLESQVRSSRVKGGCVDSRISVAAEGGVSGNVAEAIHSTGCVMQRVRLCDEQESTEIVE